MELLQLRYFLESADTENFSKTAEKFMVPPSSVSISVKRLEKELGESLFDRMGNKISLNRNGRILRDALKTALPAIDGATAEISFASENEAGDIHLLIRSERRVITEHFIEFKKQYPNVVFHLIHDFSTKDIDKYDIIIDEQSDRYKGFERFPMLSEKLRLAAGINNQLCNKPLTLDMLYSQPFISMGEGSSIKRLTLEICKKAGFTPNIIVESDDPYYLRKYIELGFGIAFVPEISWQGELSDKITYLNVIDLDYSRITYAYLNKERSRAAQEFYNYLLKKEKRL